jgi:hypothetical protein
MVDRELAESSPALAELAVHPEALLWASLCAWVPGTGYCRNRPCSQECLFRDRRAAEAEQIVRARRRRRGGASRSGRCAGAPLPR